MVLVLITGSSSSGKSTLASIVSKTIKSNVIIPQDSFYKHDFVQFPYTEDMGDKMEMPDSINWGGLLDVVKCNIGNHSNVIVEGHCVLACTDLVHMADIIFFVNRPKNVCKSRFMDRYSDGLTTTQNEMKSAYFDNVVWRCHEKYMEEYVRERALDDNFYKLPGIKFSAKMIESILESYH